MRIIVKNNNMTMTNCYIVANEDTKEALVIDPGGDGEGIAKEIEKEGLSPVAILLTHGHADHTNGIEDLNANLSTPLKVYANEDEKELLEKPEMNLSKLLGMGNHSYSADIFMKDGEIIELAGLSFKVIATPGHTPGGCCFYFENEGKLFAGDTLFSLSVGRTDLPGSDTQTLMDSIKEKLFLLPDETEVFPGHNSPTNIGREKKYNYFLK